MDGKTPTITIEWFENELRLATVSKGKWRNAMLAVLMEFYIAFELVGKIHINTSYPWLRDNMKKCRDVLHAYFHRYIADTITRQSLLKCRDLFDPSNFIQFQWLP